MEPITALGILGASMPLITAGVWAVRVEGKVKAHDQLFEERKTQDMLRYELLSETAKRTETKVDRIEQYLLAQASKQ